ncbi:MAG: transcriptional regulator, partial [bacterium]|nr:transcriptional regulator [bacterium]
KPKYFHHTVGYNSRLDTLQAAMLLVKLPHLKAWSQARAEHARIYGEALRDLAGLKTPVVKDFSTFHIYNQYTLASANRDKLEAGLKEANIGHCIYYPLPFHRQVCFENLGYKENDFPVANKAGDEVISIPVSPEMTAEEQREVIDTIKRIVS